MENNFPIEKVIEIINKQSKSWNVPVVTLIPLQSKDPFKVLLSTIISLRTKDEVTDEQLANAKYKFPLQTPTSKEEFYYRSIFNEHFPSDAAALCVPQEASVACSTKIALEWDESFKNMNDPSGRAVAKVHSDAYVKS